MKRIQARIAANLVPVRPLASSRLFLCACAIIFLGVVAIGIAPAGMNGWAALNAAQRIAVFATLAAGSGLLAVAMIGQMVPGNKYALALAVLAMSVLAVFPVITAIMFRYHEESAFVANGLMCVRSGLTFSIPAAFLFWLVLRRGAMLLPKLIGTAVGGLAGLVGLSVLEFNCPNVGVLHILVWHWGVVLISAVAGTLVGAAVDYVRRRRTPETS